MDEPVEYGTWESGGSGARTDLLALQQRIRDGASERDISEEFFADYLRYGTGIRRYIDLRKHVEPRNFKTTVIVYYGPPGTGKSFSAMEGGAKWILSSSNYPWFDGYNGTDIVLIDDFYGWIKFHHLLVLLDAYPCKVQKKGGMIEWAPPKIFITSNRDPSLWYNDSNLEYGALRRRIEEITLKDTVYTN